MSFLTVYSLNAVPLSGSLRVQLRAGFSGHYALLLLLEAVNNRSPWANNATKTDSFRIYTTEVASDLCQSLLIAVQGLYKPAYLILRSSVENAIRSIGIAQDQAVLSITSTFELIDVVKDTPLVKANPEARRLFETLRREYAELCRYVHTSSIHHMAQTAIVGSFPNYSNADSVSFFSRFSLIVKAITSITAMALELKPSHMHHSHFDMLCDALPARVKRSLFE